MTGAERQKAYKERRRAEAEAGLPREAPRKRYELAYGADGRVIAWRQLGSPQWVMGPGPGGERYEGLSVAGVTRSGKHVGGPERLSEGTDRESTPQEATEHLEGLREQLRNYGARMAARAESVEG
jgi:hypothetical protein